MKHPYEDILHLSRPQSPNRKKMSMVDRAAQFVPFAALTGYDGAIKETARLTDEELQLDENQLEKLNEKLLVVQENIPNRVPVTIHYFEKDVLKSGGAYLTYTGIIKRIDDYEKVIIFEDKTKIKICTIIQIECELF